jgi:hypothetical protein
LQARIIGETSLENSGIADECRNAWFLPFPLAKGSPAAEKLSEQIN